MNMKVILFATLFVFVLGGLAAAQNMTEPDLQQYTFNSPDEPDPGMPDTVRLIGSSIPFGTTHFTVPVTLYNDEELGGFNLPITWDSPDIYCDSVSFVGSRAEYVNTKLFSIDTTGQMFQAGIIIFFEAYLPPGDGMIYTAHFSVKPGAVDQVINFDSTFYPPGGNFALTLASGLNILPQFIPGSVIYGNPVTDPTISLAPSFFTFGAVEGEANPPSQTLTITNTGAGSLEWTASNLSGWLTVDPASGSGDGSAAVSVDITGMTSGAYFDTITVSDPAATNDPQKTPVTLIIAEPPPTLVLNPTSFNYAVTEGDAMPDDQLSVTNSGGGTLDWSAINTAGWLTLSPTSGVGDGIITLSFNIAGVSAGIYYDTITVSDPSATNDPQKSTIILTIQEPPPIIALSPGEFSYTITEGDAIGDASLSITNDGGGVLNWTAANTELWLSLDPTSGTGDGMVTLSFDVAGLSAGTYYDTITVSDPAAANDPQKAAVTVVVESPPPTIALDPSSFNYAITEGGSLPDDQLNITNVGGGVLNWTAGNFDVWLSLDPTSGTGDGSVTLSFDVSGLPAGSYLDTIVVSDPAATNDLQYVFVNLTVNATPIPVISVSPTSFNFDAVEGGGNPPSQTLTITNIGDGTLEWTVSEAAGWLSLNPLSGSGNGSSEVSVDMTGLTPGVYNTNITVTDPIASNSPVSVPVTFTIEALPVIVVSPTEYNFVITEGDGLPDAELTITNGGGGTLNWTAANLSGWMTLDPISGTGDGMVTLSFDVAAVPAGVYYDTITVSDPGAVNDPVNVPVMLTINTPPPVISLDLSNIDLEVYEGGVIPNAQIMITNTGGGTLDWTASNQTSWITLDPTSGSGDGMVTLSFDITGIMPGEYYDTVFVSDPAAVNTPQYTVVTLTVYETDFVDVEIVGGFPGEHVEVEVAYSNSTTTDEISLPLKFDNTDVVCDSVSFQNTRLGAPDESVVTIDNANGTVHLFGFAINGAILPPGSGTLIRMFFTVDALAPAQFVTIDTAMIPPDIGYEFTDAVGAPKETNFSSGGIDITDTPCFEFPTDTVAFEFDLGGIVPSISIPITNTCGGLLEWSVTDGADWLVMVPTSGTQNDPAVFDIDTTGLAPGMYETTATFESNGEGTPYTVVVILNLRAIAIITLSPEMIDFGQVCLGEVLDGSFDIINSGTAPLDWHAEAPAEVTLSDYSGTAPSMVSFSIQTDLLGVGHHTLEVVVNSDGALNTPQMITLKLFVVDCDACTFDIADMDGAQGVPVGIPVYANGVSNVAGLQFNIGYDPAVVTPDSVTSMYMTGPTIGFADSQIHYVWDNIISPFTVPDGEAVITLWVTPIGDLGQDNCFEWTGINEITDPYGIPYEGVVYCGGCLTVISPFFSMSGNIVYYDMVRAVPGVTVDLSGDASATTSTDDHGDYGFVDMGSGNYGISPSCPNNDPGVSVADVIKIRRHLAFVEEFDSPYKMIAADVNLSNTVTVADVVLIRRYLAELDMLPSGNWTFIDADFAISMSNWFDAPRAITASITNKDIEMLNFVGIRYGDVNNTWSQVLASKAGSAVELKIPDIIVAPSDDIMVPIVVANFNAVAGIEIHITYDMAYASIDSIASPVMLDPTVNAVDGRAHLIWEDFESPLTLADGETLVLIYFHVMPTATGDLPLEFMANCELTDEIGNPYQLSLINGKLVVEPTDVDDQTSNLPMQFELKQNYPNPFNPSTKISYTVDKAMSLVLEVYNVSGQVVDRIDLGRQVAGNHSFTYYGNTLASGIYTYRLVGDGVSAARQMMLVK